MWPKTCNRTSGSQASAEHSSRLSTKSQYGMRSKDEGEVGVCGLGGHGLSSGVKSRAASAGHPADLPLRLVSNIPRGGPWVILQKAHIRFKPLNAAREQYSHSICVSRGMMLFTAVKWKPSISVTRPCRSSLAYRVLAGILECSCITPHRSLLVEVIILYQVLS